MGATEFNLHGPTVPSLLRRQGWHVRVMDYSWLRRLHVVGLRLRVRYHPWLRRRRVISTDTDADAADCVPPRVLCARSSATAAGHGHRHSPHLLVVRLRRQRRLLDVLALLLHLMRRRQRRRLLHLMRRQRRLLKLLLRHHWLIRLWLLWLLWLL
jgi:hypothetical protein